MKQSTNLKKNEGGYGMVASLVMLVAGLLVTLVGLRFLFRLFAANPDNGFVNWVYSASEPFVSPFFGIFNGDVNTVNGGRFEWETLIALLVYGLVAAVIVNALSWPTRHRPVTY